MLVSMQFLSIFGEQFYHSQWFNCQKIFSFIFCCTGSLNLLKLIFELLLQAYLLHICYDNCKSYAVAWQANLTAQEQSCYGVG